MKFLDFSTKEIDLIAKAKSDGINSLESADRKILVLLTYNSLDKRAKAAIRTLMHFELEKAENRPEIKAVFRQHGRHKYHSLLLALTTIFIETYKQAIFEDHYSIILSDIAYHTSTQLFKSGSKWIDTADVNNLKQAKAGRKIDKFWTPDKDEHLLRYYQKVSEENPKISKPDFVKKWFEEFQFVGDDQRKSKNFSNRKVVDHLHYLQSMHLEIEKLEKRNRELDEGIEELLRESLQQKSSGDLTKIKP